MDDGSASRRLHAIRASLRRASVFAAVLTAVAALLAAARFGGDRDRVDRVLRADVVGDLEAGRALGAVRLAERAHIEGSWIRRELVVDVDDQRIAQLGIEV